MSLRFIIDGCNAAHHKSFAVLNSKRKPDSRIRLLEYICQHKLAGSTNNQVIVVFDGYPDNVLIQLSRSLPLSVLFSFEKSADDKIRELLADSSNPKKDVVVSDDKEVLFFTRASFAKPCKVEEFISPEKMRRSPEPKEPTLSYGQMQAINEELKKRWLE